MEPSVNRSLHMTCCIRWHVAAFLSVLGSACLLLEVRLASPNGHCDEVVLLAQNLSSISPLLTFMTWPTCPWEKCCTFWHLLLQAMISPQLTLVPPGPFILFHQDKSFSSIEKSHHQVVQLSYHENGEFWSGDALMYLHGLVGTLILLATLLGVFGPYLVLGLWRPCSVCPGPLLLSNLLGSMLLNWPCTSQ